MAKARKESTSPNQPDDDTSAAKSVAASTGRPLGGLEDEASGIRERLNAVATQHPPASIARKTGTSVSNVSRYLAGRRVPAEFCAALIRSCGVNASWLMTGEGQRDVSAMTADTGKMAGDLLALVRAMAAVTNARIGALGGKGHALALRELNDALTEYERLRVTLNERTQPVLSQLMTVAGTCFEKRDFSQGAEMLKACHQVGRLCDDEALHNRLLSLQAWVESSIGSPEQAAATLRKVIMRTYVSKGMSDELLYFAANMTIVLLTQNRLKEVRRWCQALTILAGDEPALSDSMFMTLLKCREAECDLHLGNLAEALHGMTRIYPRLTKHAAALDQCAAYLHEIHLMAGLVPLSRFFNEPVESHGMPRVLVNFARWTERPEHLRQIDDLLPRAEALGVQAAELIGIKALIAARMHGDAAPFGEYLESASHRAQAAPVAHFSHCVNASQVARILMRLDQARQWLEEAIAARVSVPDGVQPFLLVDAVHHRNVLELVPPDTRDPREREWRRAAISFFEDHIARGYACFAAIRI